MAKEENKTPEEQKKLTYEQLSVWADKLEQEYKKLTAHTKNIEKELEQFRMNDYYNRAGLLFEIIKFHASRDHDNFFSQAFINRIYPEFEELVSPEKVNTDNPEKKD